MAYLGTINYIKSQLMASSQIGEKYDNDNFKPGVEAPNSYQNWRYLTDWEFKSRYSWKPFFVENIGLTHLNSNGIVFHDTEDLLDKRGFEVGFRFQDVTHGEADYGVLIKYCSYEGFELNGGNTRGLWYVNNLGQQPMVFSTMYSRNDPSSRLEIFKVLSNIEHIYRLVFHMEKEGTNFFTIFDETDGVEYYKEGFKDFENIQLPSSGRELMISSVANPSIRYIDLDSLYVKVLD